jgi:hypothetical protein
MKGRGVDRIFSFYAGNCLHILYGLGLGLIGIQFSGVPGFELKEQREFGFRVDDQFQAAAVFLERQAQAAIFGGQQGGAVGLAPSGRRTTSWVTAPSWGMFSLCHSRRTGRPSR